MNYDSKIKYVTSDLFLIECDWLLQNNLFKIKFSDRSSIIASTRICNISKHFAWMSFFCTIFEQPTVAASTEYLKKTLGPVGMWFSTWWSVVLDKGGYDHDRWI